MRVNKPLSIAIISILFLLLSCDHLKKPLKTAAYRDTAFQQDYSVKYFCPDTTVRLKKVVSDRNGNILILTSHGLMKPSGGSLLFPGTIVSERLYRPVADKKIQGITRQQGQFVYCDDKAVLSNAWAGKMYSHHSLPEACILQGGNDGTFMISDGKSIHLLEESALLWAGTTEDGIKDIIFDKKNDTFWILGKQSVSTYKPGDVTLQSLLTGHNLTCIAFFQNRLIAGTGNGWFEIDATSGSANNMLHSKMPCPELTTVAEVNGNIWFGSTRGAMMLRDDGKYNYYASERWLPSDSVIDISEGPDNSVLVLTSKGLATIKSDYITLHDKAMFFEKQVRERHIRHGFNATLSGIQNGDVTTGSLEDSDNDGLWTSMYLAAESFRYAVTRSDEALENVKESLDAMERLYTITPVPGFPARSFERRGYKYDDAPWRRAEDPEWDWKSTTSSDEAIGHVFAFGVIAELMDVPEIRNKAVMLIDTLMSHIVKNDLYLIDWDGKPTRWGRWNPGYVNGFPEMIGDRKLNSSNIIGMLQTAYRFTGKEKYRTTAFQLMKEHGYLDNLMKPMEQIGVAPENAGDLSKLLSEGWNHSDDEMYFCGYWGLYRYAFNDTLKRKYRDAIRDHWQSERPEKDGLWNIMTALTLTGDIDLEHAIWYLKEYPVDLIEWDVRNSYRKDIEFIDAGFRNQTISEVLPPDELPVLRHNANRFILDGGNNGTSEMSAGDIWLLPYWMGRYLKVISAPESSNL